MNCYVLAFVFVSFSSFDFSNWLCFSVVSFFLVMVICSFYNNINKEIIKNGGSVVDHTLDFQSWDHKFDSPLLSLSDENLNQDPVSV